ncbi:aminoglycoside phosphotransferase (APT) family kinase protein [Lysinibacillus parviboronicapiens]|uniref:Aminoglycoside phosphotransferase (APT) family kinase protein n=1 Tax=Lysinibacillus parviboronicapiens TaxID=436516 RepID=A0ABV2PF55_9BACI|nr:phosphotransferase family protein [Lysinibacillus parviboronicapiens]
MDTMQVRASERIDAQRLHAFLKTQFADLPEGKLEITQFSAGHSNLTYCLKVGDFEAVLRRPPLGVVAKKAHDMQREFTILSALHPFLATVPTPYVYVNDEAIIGSDFFLMERKKGIVLDTHFPEGTENKEKLARQLSEQMVDSLVALHAIPYEKTAMKDMVKPQGFMERQVHGWIERYDKAKTSQFAEVEALTTWLKENVPTNAEATIIHYDYKLNNAMFSEDYSEMIGLFDWEMTTVGDPLADLGVAMSYWMHADDPKMLLYALGEPPITVLPGFYSREEFIARYGQKSGRDVSSINYYITFAYFKLAVICQQIYYRYVKGQTQDDRFAQMDKMVAALITQALKAIN